MGFFESINNAWQKGIDESNKRIEKEKREQENWEKEHPGEKYVKEQPKPALKSFKPMEKKVYQPGHKNMAGTVKNMALINMFGTSDLDEVFEGCAPEFTKAVYGIRDNINEMRKQNDNEAKYFELQGRYNELRKHYDELQKQYNDLSKILQNVTSQQAGR